MKSKKADTSRLDNAVAEARRNQDARNLSYREQALKLYPWICGRCSREFDRSNLRELTVHHRDHNHDNNPPDGSNWELLCIYCHENEHSRMIDSAGNKYVAEGKQQPDSVYKPFAGLKEMLKHKQ
jgi:5-methylcytosine-specific restriction endonuclease McrA